MNKLYYILPAVFFVLSVFVSCVEENISYDPDLELEFSCDTLVFDTLFVGQASVTERIMIYNNNKRALEISSVRMGGGNNSAFRFNVDGRIAGNGEILERITIKGYDSIYVFVEMTPPEVESGNTISISFDSLMFFCNGREKSVKLLAVGRDAILLNNYRLDADEEFSSERPYLVFGHIYVPENKRLILGEGTELYMHSGANIVADGDLEIHGTFEKPVLIRGDRFDRINDADETPYDQMPNQWGGIYLQNPNSEYVFENVVVRGSSVGVLLIGARRNNSSLTFRNSVLHNSGTYGIYSQMGNIIIENSEISNCGESCLVMIGGNVHMVHSTIANYYRFSGRNNPSVRFIGYLIQNGIKQTFPFSSVVVENSIIFGSHPEELELVRDTVAATDFNFAFSHTLIKGKKISSPVFYNCRWARSQNYPSARDTVFVNTSVANIQETGYYNFHLDSLSYARNGASIPVSSMYPIDLDGKERSRDAIPDMGAYEF